MDRKKWNLQFESFSEWKKVLLAYSLIHIEYTTLLIMEQFQLFIAIKCESHYVTYLNAVVPLIRFLIEFNFFVLRMAEAISIGHSKIAFIYNKVSTGGSFQ